MKYVYSTILDPDPQLDNPKEILGGKGAGLFDMSSHGLPVPPAFTITTDACNKYLNESGSTKDAFLNAMTTEALWHYEKLSEKLGYAPLVSVRSGARVSMPGMMDTILNVGITTETLNFWKDRLGERAALDSYRRLIQMYGSVVDGVPHHEFDTIFKTVKAAAEVENDSDLLGTALWSVIDRYMALYQDHTGHGFPHTLKDQLRGAIKAVFDSWNNERAITYRKLNNIPADWGTAVTVQTMVFGNLNDQSCSGVLFTRCPSTGKKQLVGEFLPNAQGEDVVAGIRTPFPLLEMEKWNPVAHGELFNLVCNLESFYRDMQDVEFTVENGKLYVLQTRNGKRSARAAFKIAHDLWKEEMIPLKTALSRVSVKEYLLLKKPVLDPKFSTAPQFTGIPAGGNVVTGVIAKSSAAAVKMSVPCILVTHETTPDDIEGMNSAVGILTVTGGLTSHAAVVARGMNKTCVVGCTDLNPSGLVEGWKITIDGHTGKVWVNTDVPILPGMVIPEATALMKAALAEGHPCIKTLNPDDAWGGKAYVDSSLFETPTGLDSIAMMDAIDALCAKGVDVIVDLTSKAATLTGPDFMLEYIASPPLDTQLLYKLKISALNTHETTKVSCVLPSDIDVTLAKTLVLPRIPQVSTLSDILCDNPPAIQITPASLKYLFGGEKAFQTFMKLMKDSGKEIDIMSAPLSPMDAMYSALTA